MRSYLRVARNRDAQAAMRFGEMYLAGRGAPQDPVKAWCWFRVVSTSGFAGAGDRVSACEERMTAEQRKQAVTSLAELTTDLQEIAAASVQSPRRQTEQP
jgi:TPR repeat protein